MKKILSFMILALLLSSSISFASVGIRLNGSMVGTATDINIVCGSGTNTVMTNDGAIYNINCSPNLQTSGIANGGAVSLATIDAGVPVSFSYVRKAISNLGSTTDPIPNGIPGQMMVISITSVVGGGTWTLTPATATGWKNIQFNAAGQSALFTYVNDTVGWIYPVSGSTGATNDPTITLSST